MQEKDVREHMTVYDQLQDLAYNLRWDWHQPTRDLFQELDPVLWEQVRHSPVALLRRLDPDDLGSRDGLQERVQRLHENLHRYLRAPEVWYAGERERDRPLTAYFSAEFGLTESLRIYSGGLGVLAGDHLKSSSDLGIPLVAVGLFYREGYFKQHLDAGGGQRETFPVADLDDLPGRQVMARVWRLDVGRIPLFLLDTDLPENTQEDRDLTLRLYGGAQVMRLSQEIVLGIGGYRALAAMGVRPRSFHMNEGHSAFLGLELVRDLMQGEGLEFGDAVTATRRRCVFTTHTPVPAGHDRFSRELVEEYLTGTAHGLELDLDAFMDLGRANPGTDDPFTMTVLAARLSDQINGVSALHGRVSREMWHGLWPDRPVDEVPIGHITNGVHLPSWVHPDVADLYSESPDRLGLGDGALEIDPDRLWAVRSERRQALVDYVRRTTGAQLDPEALTISFARRFATYKRATLLFDDLDRLDALLNDPERPVQLLFSGKAHPKDEPGKAFIRRIGEVSRMDRFRDRVVFLPDYGIDVARELVQGADVWLNNPRRPMEASGTSGMKAAANGVLNVSILDGWWDEAWQERDRAALDPGWAVGGVEGADRTAADRADAEAMLRILEDDVVPTFYDHHDGVPQGWLARSRESIRQLAPVFNTHRMLRDYVARYEKAAAAAAPVG